MNGKSSALLGLAIGLALTAALVLPTADRPNLVAQGMGSLLAAHADHATQAQAAVQAREEALAAGEQPGPLDPRWTDSSTSLFAALDRAAGPDAETVVLTATILVDGQAPEGDSAAAFRRALGSRINAINDALGGDAPRYRVALAAEPQAVSMTLRVDTDDEVVRLSADVAGAHGRFAVDPPVDGLERPGDDPLPTAWTIPGRLALLPPVLAIFVALVFRRTLLALFLGIFSGAAAMVWLRDGHDWLTALPVGLGEVFSVYLLGELVDTFRIEIIGFVIALVAMVGVMSRSGGVQGLIELLLGFAKTVRSTLFVTWGMGLLIFFDDYANCLLVGNTMRPLTDRLRISREKLAYIVDSTAAPIAGVSMLSTWIAFEVSTFEPHLPGAGITENAYAVFMMTIPFRFYCLFTLMFVGLTILTKRDFGPMARAEERARLTGLLVREGGTPMVSDEATRIEPQDGMPRRWFDAGLPILLVLASTLAWIFVDGGGFDRAWNSEPGGLLTLEGVTGVLFDGSGGKPIFYGACAGLALAAFLAGSLALRVAIVVGLVCAQLTSDGLTDWMLQLELVTSGADWGLLGSFAPYLSYGLTFALGGLIGGLLTTTTLGATRRPHLPLGEIQRAGLSSVKALFFAVAILFCAWMIGAVCRDLSTADYLVALLSGAVSAEALPVLLFVAACLVAFATGSSWSTMSILLPNVVALAAAVGEDAGLGALAMVVLCIGAVLEGSIFGDHCSPISDTTVLSSVSSASDHIDHVRTQAPYALTTAGLAITLGYLPAVMVPGWNSLWSLLLGFGAIIGLLLVVGRQAPDPA